MANSMLALWPELAAQGKGGKSRSAGTAEPAGYAGPLGKLALVLDPLRVMLVLLTIINISRVHQSFAPLAKLRPGLLLVVFAGAYAYLNAKSLTRANIFATWPMKRVAILAVIVAASMAFGMSIGGSGAFIVENYSKTLLYCALIALAIRHVRDLYTFVWAYAISTGILVFYSLFVYQLKQENVGTIRLSTMNTYDANDVCVVLLVGVACILLLLQVARGPQKLFLLTVLAGVGATFARAGSRGGFVGLVALVGFALLVMNSVSIIKRVSLVVAMVLGMVAFAPPGYFEQMATILSPKDDYNFSSQNGRKALITRGLKYMAAYPVFGVGIGNFPRAECTPELSGIPAGRGGTRCGAPHNSFMQAGSESGVLGLLAWSSIVLGGVWSLLRFRRKLPRRWRRGVQAERFLYNAPTCFAIGLVGFAASSFFVSFAWMEVLYLLVAMISGLYVSVRVYTTAGAAPVAGAPVRAARRGPGWRVLESARRNGVAPHRALQAGTARAAITAGSAEPR